MSENLDQLIDFCKLNNRVCPQPQYWSILWNKLKDKKRKGSSWEPSLPLILAAWWDTPLNFKQLRFIEHLTWANDHGQLDEIVKFVTGLTEDQWFHGND